LDISAVPLLKQHSHLPVVVDPSHAVGKRELVIPVALAAVAAGADAIMVEIHPNPDTALSDGRQSLTLEAFAEMMVLVNKVAESLNGVSLGELKCA
jgi:3-deoxy-7-phosphoheptulonate synthase